MRAKRGRRVGGSAAAGKGTEEGEIPEDLREAWEERAVSLVADGRLPRAEAKRQQQGRQLARQAALRGTRVAVLAPEAYGGYKDVNEAWAAGVLAVGAWPAAAGAEGSHRPPALQDLWDERASIMQFDGGLSRPAAEQAARRSLLFETDPTPWERAP